MKCPNTIGNANTGEKKFDKYIDETKTSPFMSGKGQF